ncbi:hypothetical protein TELCIR_11167 [Teladorsagia circumcincta]|uniref:Uncharacterized protein n=1 Tax=Teladorsagia circumcincta TaxID=45464 RepID=A0A2G9UA57_TELCI|nr:hypothetical protein TELCIR_11167 [Teladorsagia circumcincta]
MPSHVGAMNFDYGAARQCFEQIREPMNQAIACFERFYDGTCATGEPQMVQPTDIEIFKLTLYSRLESMLSNSEGASECANVICIAICNAVML